MVKNKDSRLGLRQGVDGWLAVQLQSSVLELHTGQPVTTCIDSRATSVMIRDLSLVGTRQGHFGRNCLTRIAIPHTRHLAEH